ncbi:MAG: hypothetical protein HY820_17375 [Acidobacteria bacterium]|nr:hypothetical protein [Acidobacteriota bacterium]
MSNKWLITAALAVGAMTAQTQVPLNSNSTMHITLPDDSPLSVLSADWRESTVTPRGSAMLLDLHTSLSFRNSSQRRVRGVTLLATAHEVAPGGKMSVSVPSLDIGPGEVFPVRLDVRLLRPATKGDGALVEITLDGVLFEDLSFYGANKLNSRRTMTMWELEARRDRKYLRGVYETAGLDALSRHMRDVQAKLSERPKVDVQMARRGGGRTTAQESERSVRFAFLDMPGEPVRATSGSATVSHSQARAPQIEVENVGNRPVRYLEIGWIMKDRSGEEFYAGAVPAELNLQPGQRGKVQHDSALTLSQRNGQPVPVAGMTGFVNHVEFADGSMWIPQKSSLVDDPRLKRVLNPSAEEQRLSDLYRRKGIHAVVDELRRHN